MTTYQIVIDGHLGPEWSAWLEPMTLTRCEDGTTRIVGPVVDDAALYGLLTRLRDLGATLLRVERLDAVRDDAVRDTAKGEP